MKEITTSLLIGGEELLLHPGRAVIWPRRKTVVVADTHFGKSSFFGRHGIAVPAGSDDADRSRLNRVLRETGAERLLVLGDFLHAPIAADSREASDLTAWARAIAPVRVTVIAGNHDRYAPTPAGIERVEGELLEPPFRFVHEATSAGKVDEWFTLSGHIHPVMALTALRKRALRVPVFWQRAAGLVLPAFGAFTGGYLVRPVPGEALFAVGPDAVRRISDLRSAAGRSPPP